MFLSCQSFEALNLDGLQVSKSAELENWKSKQSKRFFCRRDGSLILTQDYFLTMSLLTVPQSFLEVSKVYKLHPEVGTNLFFL